MMIDTMDENIRNQIIDQIRNDPETKGLNVDSIISILSSLISSSNTQNTQTANKTPDNDLENIRNKLSKPNEKLLFDEAVNQGITNLSQIAYILGTAKHETGSVAPIVEKGGRLGESYFDKYAGIIGNKGIEDARTYKGRGFVQLTGRNNYAKYGQKYGVDLINNPDLALDPNLSAKITIDGIINGGFTGKKISQFTDANGNVDFFNARSIVNGIRSREGQKQANNVARLSNEYLNKLIN